MNSPRRARLHGSITWLIYQQFQANPLNTYLSGKPGFTSPQPLAAASSLTIPLQITLSEIKLSAFIILVFSKQKGLTLVFRNDPLESLKVSSTFDSIQFVRDYLQRTIEGKLRDLMMDELPAIIHRLSLQLWCPDQIAKDEEPREVDEHAINPLATPPLDAVDANGRLLDPAAISELSLDGGPDAQSLFSQKNLQRLSALTNSQVTSSLYTPAVRDVMYRAWAAPSDKVDIANTPPLSTPNLTRSSSYGGSAHTYTFSDSGSQYQGSLSSRSSVMNISSSTAGLTLGSGRHSKAGRKKKTRVVNLRRKADTEVSSEQGYDGSEATSEATSGAACTGALTSGPVMSHPTLEVPEEKPEILSTSTGKVRFDQPSDLPPQQPKRPSIRPEAVTTQVPDVQAPSVKVGGEIGTTAQPSPQFSEKQGAALPAPSPAREPSASPADIKPEWVRSRPVSDASAILEQAWIMKMASEIARRVYEEKSRQPTFWDDRDDTPPPAYEAAR